LKNEKLFEKKALRAFGGFAAALFAFGLVFAGCDNGSGDTDPYEKVHIEAGRNISTDWGQINEDVRIAGQYVNLDLSDCIATGNRISGKFFETTHPPTPEAAPSGNDFNIIYNNEYIKRIILPKTLKTIEDSALDECSNLTSVTIPDGVISIGKYAFDDCFGLTGITIPDSVTGIGEYAFYGSGLTIVTIPDSVESIDSNAFKNCSKLTSVTFRNSVTSIGGSVFYGCSKLTSVTLPDKLTSIEEYTFEDCSSLKKITIPDSVTKIGDNAFYNCSSLTSVIIPGSVTSIGSNVFWGCTNLSTIKVDDANANYCSEDGVLFDNAETTLIQYPGGKTDKTYTIPDSVKSIGTNAFRGSTNLTEVTIPDSVTSIGAGAFYGCSSLATVNFLVSSINSNSFGSKAFPDSPLESGKGGDALKNAYNNGGAGTYKLEMANGGSTWNWKKQ